MKEETGRAPFLVDSLLIREKGLMNQMEELKNEGSIKVQDLKSNTISMQVLPLIILTITAFLKRLEKSWTKLDISLRVSFAILLKIQTTKLILDLEKITLPMLSLRILSTFLNSFRILLANLLNSFLYTLRSTKIN